MRGDGNIRFKFFGLGRDSDYQAHVEVFYDDKMVFEGESFNGWLEVPVKKKNIYYIRATFLSEKIETIIYNINDIYCFFFNHSTLNNRTITFLLRVLYYDMPISRGEIILWQRLYLLQMVQVLLI